MEDRMIEAKMTGADIRLMDCELEVPQLGEDGAPQTNADGSLKTMLIPGKRLVAMDRAAATVWLLEFTEEAAEQLAAALTNKPAVFVPKVFAGHLGPNGTQRLKI
jgi:hypothetical protein